LQTMAVKLLPMAELSEPLLQNWQLTCDPKVLVQNYGNYWW
jgi:hypothetical protein